VQLPDTEKVAVLTQTTLSVDDTRGVIEVLKQRFPKLVTAAKEDICYATQNRQDAVKQLAKEVDVVLVIGSRNSENSNQLRNVAEAQGVQAYLINDHRAIDPNWLERKKRIGITSGASVPESLVQEAAEFFKSQGARISSLGFTEENIHFSLPKEISDFA
jgi:4-hydroxy-3-methylbut-2-enyl diphosphate reductase